MTTGKAKHTATTNRGGGKPTKYDCLLCGATTPDIKSMQIHHDARHPNIPFAESERRNKKDRLSSLPDDILVSCILFRLPTREAHRTTLLASSWRDLWLFVPGLNLDGYYHDCLRKLHKAASRYSEWVDQSIDARRGKIAVRNSFSILELEEDILENLKIRRLSRMGGSNH